MRFNQSCDLLCTSTSSLVSVDFTGTMIFKFFFKGKLASADLEEEHQKMKAEQRSLMHTEETPKSLSEKLKQKSKPTASHQ